MDERRERENRGTKWRMDKRGRGGKERREKKVRNEGRKRDKKEGRMNLIARIELTAKCFLIADNGCSSTFSPIFKYCLSFSFVTLTLLMFRVKSLSVRCSASSLTPSSKLAKEDSNRRNSMVVGNAFITSSSPSLILWRGIQNIKKIYTRVCS